MEASAAPGQTRTSRWRLALFAGGDFAFNLYWQSATLWLLFTYTEAFGLSMETAAALYAFGSLWDGIVSLAIGIMVDRWIAPERYRRALVWGSIPLGLAFVGAYLPPPAGDGWLPAVWVLGFHLLFRMLYALVNIPYLAMSARISVMDRDRAIVSGGRMLAGTTAAALIAWGTVPLGERLSGASGPEAYTMAAMAFAALATPCLIGLGLSYRDGTLPPAAPASSLRDALAGCLRNRAFLTLAASMVAMVAAVTVFDKTVLYYFKYVLHDQAAGQWTLGWMMAVSGGAVPLWWWLSRHVGTRGVWVAAALLAIACLLGFAFADLHGLHLVQAFLIVVQTAIVGLNFALWALLPDTVEYGQRQSGIRSEAVLYGLTALLQRLAIGLGTLVLGFSVGQVDGHHGAADDATYRLTLALIPLAFFVLAWLLMWFNPLRRGRHGEIVSQLVARSESRLNAPD